MNIWVFRLDRYKKNISKEVLQVEEKPKTYFTTNTAWRTRINKSDIGKVVSYNKVYLLEDDIEKAKNIFTEKIKGEIDYNKNRLCDIESEIKELEILRDTLI